MWLNHIFFVVLSLLWARFSMALKTFSKLNPSHVTIASTVPSRGFVAISRSPCQPTTVSLAAGYARPEDSEQIERQNKTSAKRGPPYPKIGDLVRYYDLDGGFEKGQILVGKIVYISPKGNVKDKGDQYEEKEWLVDLSELDYVGSGYYAEYSSRTAPRKRTTRDVREVSPILGASYVRSEDAYKIPMATSPNANKREEPLVSYEKYSLDGYEGPKTNLVINDQVVESDFKRYEDLKRELFIDSVTAGSIGTVVAQITRGTDDAVCYAAGAAAGVGYLYFLSMKTDTIGQPSEKFGSRLSGIRFLLPVLVLCALAFRNIISGRDDEIIVSGNFFSTVSKEQFAAVVLGLITYRIPLFLRQLLNPLIFPSSGDAITTATFLPGSAGIALQIMQNEKKTEPYSSSISIQELQPILLVSGPEGTGKSSLLKRLMNDDIDGRFVLPRLIDKIADGPRFEVMERRGQVLKMIDSRYALSLDGILNTVAEEKDIKQQKVAVILDVDVDLARTLFKELSGKAKIIGVWVGLDSLDKLKDRLKSKLASTAIQFPPGETEETYIRAKIRKVIKDIEFGVVSGMFDFTILNDDFDISLAELKEAAKYCFK